MHRTTTPKWSRWLLLLLPLALLAAACSSDDDAGSDSGESGGGGEELVELTAILPFASGINFYPLLVAEENGYLAEEGLTLNVQAAEGSGAAQQQVLAGQAEMCLCSPGPFLNAVAEGADLVAVYTMYQSDVFALVTAGGSEITSADQLSGATVGVGTIDGGETSWLTSLLQANEGLAQDEDYELLAVGEGGAALAAFERGDIDAYAAAFPDVAIMRLQGADVSTIDIEGTENFFDSLVVMTGEYVEDNPEIVEGLGRALAKATVWGAENPEAVLEITAEQFPEEVEDMEFAAALLDETQALFELPESAEGQWGISVPERVDGLIEYLVSQGAVPEGASSEVFINDHVEAYNDFTDDDL